MRSAAFRRLRLTLVLLAWCAQLCLPAAHAALMAASPAQMAGWCGDPSRASAMAAELPAELRDALGLDGADADRLAACAELCATGSTAGPVPSAPANTVALRAAGLEPAPAMRPAPRVRGQASPPPAQGPPARA